MAAGSKMAAVTWFCHVSKAQRTPARNEMAGGTRQSRIWTNSYQSQAKRKQTRQLSRMLAGDGSTGVRALRSQLGAAALAAVDAPGLQSRAARLKSCVWATAQLCRVREWSSLNGGSSAAGGSRLQLDGLGRLSGHAVEGAWFLLPRFNLLRDLSHCRAVHPAFLLDKRRWRKGAKPHLSILLVWCPWYHGTLAIGSLKLSRVPYS